MAEYLDLNDLVAEALESAEEQRKSPRSPSQTTKEYNEAYEASFVYTRYIARATRITCACGEQWEEFTGLFLESAPIKGGCRKQSAVHFIAPHHAELPRELEIERRDAKHCTQCLSALHGFKLTQG